tara:strand:- start:69 stop:1310 length:1242 start_codon:yes stop_codon:yes gene_type:complete
MQLSPILMSQSRPLDYSELGIMALLRFGGAIGLYVKPGHSFTRHLGITNIYSRVSTISPRFFPSQAYHTNKMTPFITLEEHYISRSAVKQAGADDLYAMFPPHIVSKLADLGTERIKDLEKGEVSLQVLSHGPIDASAEVCVGANDELAAAISKNPTRLAGFALLPMIDPKAAAAELDRCVTKLGFLGALVDNHIEGQFYDDEKFWPIFEKAEELDVPIYIHPTFASDEMLEHYKGNYDDKIALALSAFGWGWHSETGLHILRLFSSGLFDRYPKLKIIIGHVSRNDPSRKDSFENLADVSTQMGEMLPFQLDRCVSVSERFNATKRSLREVWQNNIWITTSGMFSLPPLACLLQTTSINHVLYSVDYPFSPNEKGREFIDVIKESGLMGEEDFEKFAYRNAESLLKVKATAA